MFALETLSTDAQAVCFVIAAVFAAASVVIAAGRSILAWSVLVVAVVLAWNAIAAT